MIIIDIISKFFGNVLKLERKVILTYYIMSFIIFGVLYSGASFFLEDAFIVDNSLIIEKKSRTMSHKIDGFVDRKIIRNLFSEEFVKNDIKSGDSIDDIHIYRLNKIPNIWAKYYVNKFLSKNYNTFTFDYITSEKIKGEKLYSKFKIVFYKEGEKKIENIKNRSYNMWFEEETKENLLNFLKVLCRSYDNHYQVYSGMNFLIPYSVNFLDDDYNIYEELYSNRSFSIIDGFYFSAAVITTLGFGDILAFHPFIRFLVLVEALIGTILIGIFLTKLSND